MVAIVLVGIQLIKDAKSNNHAVGRKAVSKFLLEKHQLRSKPMLTVVATLPPWILMVMALLIATIVARGILTRVL